MVAYHAHNEVVEELLSAETLQDKVVVHADQAWVVDEADPGYAELHRKLTNDRIESAIARQESMYDAVQLMVFRAADLEPVIKQTFMGQSFRDLDGVYKALDCGLLGQNRARYSLQPLLKVYGRQEYIRADSKFEVIFKR